MMRPKFVTKKEEYEKYNKYLCSRAWWLKREAVMRRCKWTCERCKKNPAIQVHHLTYIRKYDELLSDLQAICSDCHKFIHAKSNYDPRK